MQSFEYQNIVAGTARRTHGRLRAGRCGMNELC